MGEEKRADETGLFAVGGSPLLQQGERRFSVAEKVARRSSGFSRGFA